MAKVRSRGTDAKPRSSTGKVCRHRQPYNIGYYASHALGNSWQQRRCYELATLNATPL